ncbi:PLxRFG domain-containing protein [Aliivibrio fischeri]|uniref:PLxRFG domain-containing protein n=1 Tax=Aliivibrio fischeri TaxID=668 RepID=UPI001F3E03CC|nr:PLxRFG domain-containing protein [Aliivibrio fischeri]MCE7567525.1 PLxRFG domain-containing protein [Aliivibrio fischeri]
MADFKAGLSAYRESKENQNTSIMGDAVDMLQAGAIDTGTGIAEFVGADNLADSMNEWSQEQYETLTPEGKVATAKSLINDDLSLGEGAKDPRTWFLTSMNVLGGMAATMVPAGAAAKGLSLAGKGTKAVSVMGKSVTGAGAASVGVNTLLNVAAGGGNAGRGVESDIKNLSFDDLKDSSQFRDLALSYSEQGLSDLEALDKARDELALRAGNELTHDFSLAVINATLEPLGDRAFGKLIKGQLGKTVKGAIAKGILAEGGTEAIQGGAEQYRENVVANKEADLGREESEGVAASALEGGLLGSLIGGGAGAPSAQVGKVRRRNFEKGIESAISQESVIQLKAAGKTDKEIRALLGEKVSNAAIERGFTSDEARELSEMAVNSAYGEIPTAEERHAEEDAQEEAIKTQVDEGEKYQPEQEQEHQPQASKAPNPLDYGLTEQDAELITDPPPELFDGFGNFNKNAPKELKQRYQILMGRQGARDFLDAEGEYRLEDRTPYPEPEQQFYPNNTQEQGQQQAAAPEEQGFYGEPQNPETIQQDQTALAESLRAGELGFADEQARQDSRFRDGLREAMDVSPAAVLEIAKMRRSGQMSEAQALSALNRVITSVNHKEDQLTPDEQELELRTKANQERAQQDFQNLDNEKRRQEIQDRLLRGQREQTHTSSYDAGERPNGEKDVSPIRTGIENQFEANAPQVEFDRWSNVQSGDQEVDQRDYVSPYATRKPETKEMEQGTVHQPRERGEQVRYTEEPTAEDYLRDNRGGPSGFLNLNQPKRNARQAKKAQQKEDKAKNAIFNRIFSNKPAEPEEPQGTEYISNTAFSDALAKALKPAKPVKQEKAGLKAFEVNKDAQRRINTSALGLALAEEIEDVKYVEPFEIAVGRLSGEKKNRVAQRVFNKDWEQINWSDDLNRSELKERWDQEIEYLKKKQERAERERAASPDAEPDKYAIDDGLTVVFDGQIYKVDSLEDARSKWRQFIYKTGSSPDEVASSIQVYDNGDLKAKIDYDGTIYTAKSDTAVMGNPFDWDVYDNPKDKEQETKEIDSKELDTKEKTRKPKIGDGLNEGITITKVGKDRYKVISGDDRDITVQVDRNKKLINVMDGSEKIGRDTYQVHYQSKGGHSSKQMYQQSVYFKLFDDAVNHVNKLINYRVDLKAKGKIANKKWNRDGEKYKALEKKWFSYSLDERNNILDESSLWVSQTKLGRDIRRVVTSEDSFTNASNTMFEKLAKALENQPAKTKEVDTKEIDTSNEPTKEANTKEIASAGGVDVSFDPVSKDIEDGYNRSTHVGRGRDFNKELKTTATNILEDLDEKGLLDTPERKAKAEELVKQYIEKSKEFIQWDATQAMNNPSWFVTGRANRNADKANKSNERHMKTYSAKVDALDMTKKNIPVRVESVMNEEQREAKKAQQADKVVNNLEKKVIGYIVRDVFNYLMEGQPLTAKDNRKWALPKAHKALEDLIAINPDKADDLIKRIDKSLMSESKGKWGIRAVLNGRRSAIGKLVDERLSGEIKEAPAKKPAPAKTKEVDTKEVDTSKLVRQAKALKSEAEKDNLLADSFSQVDREDIEQHVRHQITALEALVQNWKPEKDTVGKLNEMVQAGDVKHTIGESATKPFNELVELHHKAVTDTGFGLRKIQLLISGNLNQSAFVKRKSDYIPEIEKGITALRRVWDSVRQNNEPEPEPTPPKPTKTAPKNDEPAYERKNTAKRGDSRNKPQDVKAYLNAVTDSSTGTLSHEDYVLLAKDLVNDREAINEELGGLTKAKLFALMGPYWAATHKDYKKAQLIKSVYDDILGQMYAVVNGGGIPYVFNEDQSAFSERMIKGIEAVSKESYDKTMDKRRADAKQRKEERAKREEGLKDPKTLEDFVAYARSKTGGIDSFTDEQLKTYDALLVERGLERLKEEQKKAAEVKAVDGEVSYQLAETIHTKLQEPRYVVQLTGERMGKDAFKDLANRARQLGGNYVNAMQAKRYSTIDGFQFANEEDRNTFARLLDGDKVSSERRQAERLETKQDNRVTKLKELADVQEAKADEVINQDRKTNTARRASMAASSLDKGFQQQKDARTYRAIAQAVETGEIKLLGNLTQQVQLEELNRIVNRIVWDIPEDVREKYAYRNERGNWLMKPETTFDEIARFAKYPAPRARADLLKRIADDMEGTKGFIQAAKKIRSNIKDLGDSDQMILKGPAWDATVAKIRDYSRKNKDSYATERVDELFKTEQRLTRMGITGQSQLRFALRELEQVQSDVKTDKPVETPVSKLENKVIETIRGNRNAYNDFFPTDNDKLSDEVVELADIKKGDKVLEPSAGMGHLADKLRDAGADLDVGEFAYTMNQLLEEKGHNVVSDDFLEYESAPIYDKIVMNPPFSNDSAITHINHALTMLKDGGRLVAITPINTGDKGNSLNKNFRQYLDSVGAEEIPHPEGSFKDSINPTNVATKTIVIDKPLTSDSPVPSDIRFSQSSDIGDKTARGLNIETVNRAAQTWLDGYKGFSASNVTVVETQEQLNDLVDTQPNTKVKAVWLSGDNRVVLVAENLNSVSDVRKTLRHELIGHNGLNGMLGEEMDSLVNRVNRLRNNKLMKPLFDKVDRSYKNAPDSVKAEEVIAKLAEEERGPLKQIADKLFASVIGAMRRAGIFASDKVTVSEVREMINQADKFMRTKSGHLSMPNVVRFSQEIDEDAPDYGSPRMSYEQAINQERETFFKQMMSKGASVVKGSALYDAAKGNGWGLLSLRQLAEVAKAKVSKPYANLLDSYVTTVNRKIARQNALLEGVTSLTEDIRKWIKSGNKEKADELFDMLHQSTLANVDPSQPYEDMTDLLEDAIKVKEEQIKGRSAEARQQLFDQLADLKKDFKNERYRRVAHAKMKVLYDRLPQDSKDYFGRIRDHYTKQQDQMFNALIERATTLGMEGKGKASGKQAINIFNRLSNEFGKTHAAELGKLGSTDIAIELMMARRGFYVPLARFGNYWVSTKFENGKNKKGETQIDSQFEMFESEQDMKERVSQLRDAGFKPTFGTNIEESGHISGATMGFVSDMMDKITTANMNEDAKAQLKDDVYQMFLQSLPDRSIRKSFIHRKGTKGYSDNALRSIADQGFRQSRQQARLETEDELNAVMKGINDIAKTEINNVSAQRIATEMNKRHDWVQNPQRAKWAQTLTGFGFFWLIGASPASALMNLTQNVQVAIPVIGSKYGMARTAKEMASLTGTFMKSYKTAAENQEKKRLYGVLGSVLTDTDEIQAMRKAIEQGVIDVTQTSDALDLAEKPEGIYGDWKDRTNRVLGWTFHNAEVLNREVTFMTAYRLAKENGHKDPFGYAQKATWDSHFDYGSLNRARFMQGDVATVALQFKQYSQNMTYYLAHNFMKSLSMGAVGKNATAEEKAQARRQLLGTLALTFGLGGMSAMPVATVAMIVNMAYAAVGDDDEPFDAETELESVIGEWFGPEWAKTIYNGLPPTVGLPAIGSRINIDLAGMWFRESNADTASKTVADIGAQMFGPIGGIVSSAARGMDYMSQGRYMRGFEQVQPKWVKDIIKTARYASEGGNITNRNGEVIISDLSGIEYAGQLLGFTPTRLSTQYRSNRAIKGYESHVANRRQALLSQLWVSYMKKDRAEMKNIRRHIIKYNRSTWGRLHPITSENMERSIKSHLIMQKKAVNGLHYNPKYEMQVRKNFITE